MPAETARPRSVLPLDLSPRIPPYRARRSLYPREPFNRKRLIVGTAILAVLAALAVLDVGLTAYHLLQGRNHLLAAAKSLQAGGPTLTARQAAAAMTDLKRSQAEFASARGSFDDVLFRTASVLPFIGPQVKASRALADIGLQASTAGQLGVEIIDSLLSEHEVGPGSEKKAPGERLISLLRATDPKLQRIGRSLDALQSDRASIPRTGLLPPITSAVKQFDAKFSSLPDAYRTFRAIEPGLYAILGAGGPRSYLVLQQDAAEIRATGGFIGSVGFLHLDHGKMAPYVPQDTYEIDLNKSGPVLGSQGGARYVAPPAPLDRFIHPTSWELRDSNWFPDLQTSAKQTEFFYQRETGQQVSGVIAIDPYFVSKLLGIIGPIAIPETGDTVTAQNFFLKTIERVQLHKGPGGQKSFLTYAGKPLLERIFSLKSRQWTPLIDLLAQSCRTRSVQAYFDDPSSEALVRHFGCDGSLKATTGDGILVVDTNLDGNKDDFWVKRNFSLDIAVNRDGSARHTLRLHYSSFPQITNITGPYIGWLRVYLPPSAKLSRSEGADLRSSPELGRAVVQGWVEWRYNDHKDVTIVYDVDAPVMHAATGTLDLYWQKQAGREADPIAVTIHLPKPWSLKSATGGHRATNGSVITTDLSVDREFRFSYTAG